MLSPGRVAPARQTGSIRLCGVADRRWTGKSFSVYRRLVPRRFLDVVSSARRRQQCRRRRGVYGLPGYWHEKIKDAQEAGEFALRLGTSIIWNGRPERQAADWASVISKVCRKPVSPAQDTGGTDGRRCPRSFPHSQFFFFVGFLGNVCSSTFPERVLCVLTRLFSRSRRRCRLRDFCGSTHVGGGVTPGLFQQADKFDSHRPWRLRAAARSRRQVPHLRSQR